jgi:hypothetical protein
MCWQILGLEVLNQTKGDSNESDHNAHIHEIEASHRAAKDVEVDFCKVGQFNVRLSRKGAYGAGAE